MLPAVLVCAALVGMPGTVMEATRAGWVVVIAGLGFGAVIGVWFRLRWFPVSWLFDDPFGWPRVGLVGIQIGFVLAAGVLIVSGRWTPVFGRNCLPALYEGAFRFRMVVP